MPKKKRPALRKVASMNPVSLPERTKSGIQRTRHHQDHTEVNGGTTERTRKKPFVL